MSVDQPQQHSLASPADANSHGQERNSTAVIQTLFEYDADTRVLSWSCQETLSRIFGSGDLEPLHELAGYEAHIVGAPPQIREAAYRGDVENYVCEYQLRTFDGTSHWVEERGGWMSLGVQRKLISVIRSIEDQKQREQQLSWLACNDETTGLLNRAHLRLMIERCLESQQEGDGPSAYILAGIDDLGAINADFGFEVADEVIVSVSKRLAGALDDGDYIGRVAGTKFGILIKDADDARVRDICNQLLSAVRANVVETACDAIAASISIGAVALPRDADTSQKAMTNAEAALDQARRMGHSSWSAFSEKTDIVRQRRRNSHMSDVILTALNEGRIQLAFQPIVPDLETPARKYECLIRMRAADGNEIPAPEFIPVAERLGLVHLLDRRVLELATNTLRVCPDISLAVNVSMETVKDPVWAEGYLAHMRANEGLAKQITVELTETQVIDAIDASIDFVSEAKRCGASVAMDDFGAGYTSFRNLKALDIDILKIDGSFVTGVSNSRDNQLFVRTLLDLARNFGMKTVAEWVDNEADAILLKGLGVDYLQGYMIGKPEVHPEWLPNGAPTLRPVQQMRA